MPPSAPKSTPEPGARCIVETMVANWSCPCARSVATICACDTPGGNSLLITPSKMMLVAVPRILGPLTANTTLTTASTRTVAMRGRSGRRRANRRRDEPRKSLDLAGGRPMPMPIMPGPRGPAPGRWPMTAGAPAGAPGVAPDGPPGAPGGRLPGPLTPPPPLRKAASRRSRGTSRWTRAARGACRCQPPARRPRRQSGLRCGWCRRAARR